MDDLVGAVGGLAQDLHERWIREIKALVDVAVDGTELIADLLEWQITASLGDYPDTFGDAIALAELKGRSEVLEEGDDASFAEPTVGTVTFTEAQDFLRQKVSMPSKTWTENLHQAHDRAFVVAGADSVALVEDLRKALDDAMNGGGGLEGFRSRFDEIIERTGWEYNGGRNWRTRVIYETNLRNAHQAGRLKQMRKVAKLRPYWQYIHGEIREPVSPRAEHLAWDGLVFLHSDPIWNRIFPPNGWKCSCGVVSLSPSALKREGKTGPDKVPDLEMRRVKDTTTGQMVEVPKGIDFGWGYQPGDTWERGLVPRELQKPLDLVNPDLPLPVSPSLDDVGRPFVASELPSGKDPDYYVSRFLQRFGASIDNGVMHRDPSGQAVLISDQLFKNVDGKWKAMKRGREVQIERLAEAIFDPDEIWVDWAKGPNGTTRLVRRYFRWDPELAAFSLFEWTMRGWSGVTSFDPRAGRKQKPSRSYLEKHRRGALLYRRNQE